MFFNVFRSAFPTMHAATPRRLQDIGTQASTDIFTPFSPDEHALPAPPPVAHTLDAPRSAGRIPPAEPTQNAIDLFFGVRSSSTSSRGTVDSCHDQRPAVPTVSIVSKDAPPAYVYPVATTLDEFGVEALPTYTQTLGVDVERCIDDGPEPVCLAMYLFKFGFFCPILWFLNIFVLLCPLHAPADWEQSRTPAQRARLLARMRATEVRWAKRSLFAAFALCVVIAVVVSTVVVVARH